VACLSFNVDWSGSKRSPRAALARLSTGWATPSPSLGPRRRRWRACRGRGRGTMPAGRTCLFPAVAFRQQAALRTHLALAAAVLG